jgi:hypothetical protein
LIRELGELTEAFTKACDVLAVMKRVKKKAWD